MLDLSFYFQIGLMFLNHAKPELIQKALPVLQDIKDYISLLPGIK